jgi:hypothetical protein
MYRNGILHRFTRRHREGLRYHGTSHFLTMHRALLADFENELLTYTHGFLEGLPYWDESFDSFDPMRSRIFSDEGMGPAVSGPLRGPFAGFLDDEGNTVTRNPSFQSGSFSWAPSSQVIAEALKRFNTFGELSEVLETSPHGQYHSMIGGSMGNVSRSPSDPIFWLHHAYVDLVWAAWQGLGARNFRDLTTLGHQSPVRANDPAALYSSRSNQAVLEYRNTFCYRYQATPQTGTLSATGKSLVQIQPIDPKRLLSWMPKMNMTTVRRAEKRLNDIVIQLQNDLKSGKIQTKDISTLSELLNRGNKALERQEKLQRESIWKPKPTVRKPKSPLSQVPII